MSSREVGPGTRVSEYVLQEAIGEGGFGTVWKGVHHLWKDRVVAIKIPTNPDLLDDLRREGLLQYHLESLDNRHIVKTLGIDTAADPPYFIMEYVEGTNLRQRIEEGPRLTVDEVVDLSVQILTALRHAHEQGVVHCDLKPENILLTLDQTVKLSDFGLGQRLDPADVSLLLSQDLEDEEARVKVGTYEYMAPEQRQGRRDDPRVDIYAFGIILFEMITGERPQPGDLPGDLVPGTPRPFDEIFRRCYARIERRFSSVAEILSLLGDLASVEEEERSPVPPEVPLSPEPKVPEHAPEEKPEKAPPAQPVRTGEPPQGMVLIGAGRFTMGVPDPESDAYPEHSRHLEDYFLDLVPVTNGRFLDFVRDGGYRKKKVWGEDGWEKVEKFLDSTGRPGPRYWIDGRYPSGLEQHPVVGVSFFEARAFCRWAGKKLPSEEEWEKGARGGTSNRFPWGDDFDKSMCNTRESGWGQTTRAGKFVFGKSPLGLLDMAGNVLEWTRSFFSAYPGNEAENPYFGELYRVLRGGAWHFKKNSAETTMRFIMRPSLRWNYVGFRCAKDA